METHDANSLRPVEIPIDGELDLHTFRPGDIKSLLDEYMKACQEKGRDQIRIVHGKGRGQLLRTVHSILGKHPEVLRFSLASPLYGGAGATIVHLRARASSRPNQ